VTQFKQGDRVLDKLKKPRDEEDWAEGEVLGVDENGMVHVQWDSGKPASYPHVVAKDVLEIVK